MAAHSSLVSSSEVGRVVEVWLLVAFHTARTSFGSSGFWAYKRQSWATRNIYFLASWKSEGFLITIARHLQPNRRTATTLQLSDGTK